MIAIPAGGMAFAVQVAVGTPADKYPVGICSFTEYVMDSRTLPNLPITSPDGKDTIFVPAHLHESIVETAEIKADKDAMAAIAKGEKQAASGNTVSWESLKAELGL